MFRKLIIAACFILFINSYAQGNNLGQEATPAITKKSNKVTSSATAADILSSLEKANQPIAVQAKIKPMLTGSAELGFLYKTGNTNSGDIKTGFDLRFERGQWTSLFDLDLLIKKTDVTDADTGETHFKTTDQKWSVTSQTNYSVDNTDKNYIYGNVWYEDSNFNSFNNQSSISSGWGRHWYKSKKASLWGDIGPGYKRDVFKATSTSPERVEDSWIIQAQALYLRKLGEHVEYKQYFSAKHSVKAEQNSIYKAESTITTKLISTLQLKFTFTAVYNSEVKAGKENTDTQTAVTLVYSF